VKKTILASDFDGTMCQRYTEDGYPATAEVLAAIRLFRQAGGLFGVVTGRDWRWSWYELDKNGKLEFDFIIALNGAQIFDRAGNLLGETSVDGSIPVNGVSLTRAMAETCWETAGEVFFINRGTERFYFSPKLPDGGEWDGDNYAPHNRLDHIGTFHMAGAVAENGEKGLAAAEILRKNSARTSTPLPADGHWISLPPA